MMVRIAAGIIIGALIGTSAGYLLKCSGGGCPLTSNTWVGTVYGAIIGLMLATGN